MYFDHKKLFGLSGKYSIFFGENYFYLSSVSDLIIGKSLPKNCRVFQRHEQKFQIKLSYTLNNYIIARFAKKDCFM